jgi:hypothetical protein
VNKREWEVGEVGDFPYLIKQLKQFDPKVMKTLIRTDKVGGGTLRRARLTRAKAKRDTEEKQL